MSLKKKKKKRKYSSVKNSIEKENLGWKITSSKQQVKWFQSRSTCFVRCHVLGNHVKLILPSLFPARSRMLNAKWSLNERALMPWTNLRRDLKANVVESYIIKGPPPPPPNLEAICDRWRVSLLRRAPVPWNAAQSFTCKFLLLYKFRDRCSGLAKFFWSLTHFSQQNWQSSVFYRTTRC